MANVFRVEIEHGLDVCCLRQHIIEIAEIEAFEPDVVLYRASADSDEELDDSLSTPVSDSPSLSSALCFPNPLGRQNWF